MANSDELYLPVDDSPDPTQDDIHYAQAFGDVVACLEGVKHVEAVMLRLSTCRNAFLTVNAIFVDLRAVLGHGAMPSPLSRAVVHLRRREPSPAGRMIDNCRRLLSIAGQKRDVWQRRAELDAEIDTHLSRLGRLDRDRVRKLLSEVRTASSDGRTWDRRIYEISTDEPAHLTKLLQNLDEASAKVAGMCAVGRSLINALSNERSLFENGGANGGWPAVADALAQHAELFGMLNEEINGLKYVAWRDLNGRAVRVSLNSPTMLEQDASYLVLMQQLQRVGADVHRLLSEQFRLNAAVPRLPAPFQIDVLEVPVDERPRVQPLRLEVRGFGWERPKSIRVAVLDFGLPLAFYDLRVKHFENDDRRAFVASLAEAAVVTAADAGASAIVLPEYFLPKSHASPIAKLAADRGLVFIGGEEGEVAIHDGDRLVNRALIRIPRVTATYEQRKQKPSVYEPSLSTDGVISIFEGTPIGTFAVLVCSDILEQDLVACVASAPCPIDVLFVPAFNPHPELFESLAVADSCRLYCHVVIANNYSTEKDVDAASSKGTLACSPRTIVAEMVRQDGAEVSLHRPAVNGRVPAIRIYELSLEILDHASRKPRPGFLQVPHCRGRRQS